MIHARIGKKEPPSFSLDVEFEMGRGVTALFGPAGSGKTAILEALAGLTRPDSGRILLDDMLLFDAQAGVHVPARRRGFGYLPQRDALFPHMTLRQNLAFAAAGPRLERHRRIAEMLERFGLSEMALRKPSELDADQRLRGGLARALVAVPKLLLLDTPDLTEPLFREVRAAFDGPVLVATRDVDLASALADLMLVLDSGRILRRGTPLEVLDQPQSAQTARLLGNPNLFECTIVGLDPGRNSSRLESRGFQLAGPYLPGHFKGDRVWITIAPERVRVHAADGGAAANAVPAQLTGVSHRAQVVRLEFAGGIFADLAPDEYARRKDNRNWQVELPPEALRVL